MSSLIAFLCDDCRRQSRNVKPGWSLICRHKGVAYIVKRDGTVTVSFMQEGGQPPISDPVQSWLTRTWFR